MSLFLSSILNIFLKIKTWNNVGFELKTFSLKKIIEIPNLRIQ